MRLQEQFQKPVEDGLLAHQQLKEKTPEEQTREYAAGVAAGGGSNVSAGSIAGLISKQKFEIEQKKEDEARHNLDAIVRDAIDSQIADYRRQAEDFRDLARRHEEQAEYWKQEKEAFTKQKEELEEIKIEAKSGAISENSKGTLKKTGIDADGMSMAQVIGSIDMKLTDLSPKIEDASQREDEENKLKQVYAEKAEIADNAADSLREWGDKNPEASFEEFSAKQKEIGGGYDLSIQALYIELKVAGDNMDAYQGKAIDSFFAEKADLSVDLAANGLALNNAF